MKTIKLKIADYRRWRENKVTLVDAASGEFVRFATENEQRRINDGVKKAVRITLKDPSGRLLKPGQDRDRFKQELLKQHGTCQVRLFNGRFLCSLKDPNAKMPEHAAAPDPDRCECTKWDGRRSGRHHKACKFNAYASPDRRGDVYDEEVVDLASIPEDAPKPVAPRASTADIPTKNGKIPDPEDCVCQEWALRDGDVEGRHRQVCEWYEKWAALHGCRHLWDLGRTKRFRIASDEEIAMAEANVEKNGTSTIEVEGETFLVD